jgi:hypothetical protein
VKAWLRRARPLFAVIAGVVAVASCDQNLESGAACPALCPGSAEPVRDTEFFAVTLDTSVPGFPAIGTEPRLLIATLGDTFDARGIIRWDSLSTTYFAKAGGDSVIRSVDSARISLRVARFDTLDTDSVTFEAYDVDVAGDDTAAATLVPAFVPSNLLGSKTVVFADSAFRKDSTIVIPIDTAKLLAKITADSVNGPPRLRVGIRVTADSAAQAQILTTNASSALGAVLSYLPSATPGETRINIFPRSKTPDTDAQLRADFADFQIVAVAPPPPASDVLRVGGVPGWRAYLQFSIPPRIIDSSSVVRASLVLHQHSNVALPEPAETLYVSPWAMTASSLVDDVNRLLTFLASPGDSAAFTPGGSVVDTMEIINFVRPWRGSDSLRTPRSIALSAPLVNARAGAVEFYSNEAPDSLRPRLRLSYIPQTRRGLP